MQAVRTERLYNKVIMLVRILQINTLRKLLFWKSTDNYLLKEMHWKKEEKIAIVKGLPQANERKQSVYVNALFIGLLQKRYCN